MQNNTAKFFFGLMGAVLTFDLLNYNNQIDFTNKPQLFFIGVMGCVIGVAIHGIICTILKD